MHGMHGHCAMAQSTVFIPDLCTVYSSRSLASLVHQAPFSDLAEPRQAAPSNPSPTCKAGQPSLTTHRRSTPCLSHPPVNSPTPTLILPRMHGLLPRPQRLGQPSRQPTTTPSRRTTTRRSSTTPPIRRTTIRVPAIPRCVPARRRSGFAAHGSLARRRRRGGFSPRDGRRAIRRS